MAYWCKADNLCSIAIATSTKSQGFADVTTTQPNERATVTTIESCVTQSQNVCHYWLTRLFVPSSLDDHKRNARPLLLLLLEVIIILLLMPLFSLYN